MPAMMKPIAVEENAKIKESVKHFEAECAQAINAMIRQTNDDRRRLDEAKAKLGQAKAMNYLLTAAVEGKQPSEKKSTKIPEGWAATDLSGEALVIAAPQLPKGRVMLLVVGGGIYHEQRALERHFAQLNIHFVYGSTGFPTPDEELSAFARWNSK
ncbi:Sec1-like protein [Carpediemonas membranifera]|uniref:Sec1-like protein n=1 Tax=Carpediemonas membranifera TaxID=201153 RepID=A0A8J6AV44_9EUKA|nr:Sec1-like protein [Carpediemonas membranifera]|eukprot:KAG9393275.1 Sec1-like protein [Carpediemonas membranifera]